MHTLNNQRMVLKIVDVEHSVELAPLPCGAKLFQNKQLPLKCVKAEFQATCQSASDSWTRLVSDDGVIDRSLAESSDGSCKLRG